MTTLEELFQAALKAKPDRLVQALRFLRGEVANLTEVRTLPPPESLSENSWRVSFD